MSLQNKSSGNHFRIKGNTWCNHRDRKSLGCLKPPLLFSDKHVEMTQHTCLARVARLGRALTRLSPAPGAPGLPGAPRAGSGRSSRPHRRGRPPRTCCRLLTWRPVGSRRPGKGDLAGELQFRLQPGGKSAGAGPARAGGAGQRTQAEEVRSWRWRSGRWRGLREAPAAGCGART